MKFRFLLLGFLFSCCISVNAQVSQVGEGAFLRSDIGPMFNDTVANSFGRFAYIYNNQTLPDLRHGDTITGISFMHPKGEGLVGNTNLKIYLKSTDQADFGAGSLNWLAETRNGMALVYDGDPKNEFSSSLGFSTFTFNQLQYEFDTSGGAVHLQVLVEYTQEDAQLERKMWFCESSFTVSEFNSTNESKYVRGVGALDSICNLSSIIKPTVRLYYPRDSFDLYIDHAFGLKRVPQVKNNGRDISAKVYNAGKAKLYNYPVYLQSTGANNFRDTFTIDSLSIGEYAYIQFENYKPVFLGSDQIVISVDEQEGSMNSKSFNREVNYDLFSYSNSNSAASSFFGSDEKKVGVLARYNTIGIDQLTDVEIKFNTIGRKFKIVVWSALNGEPDTLRYESLVKETALGVSRYTIPPIEVKDDFFIGVVQDEAQSIGLAYEDQLPLIPGTFYYKENPTDTNWSDFSTFEPNAFSINPIIKSANDIKALEIMGVSDNDSFALDPSDSITVGIKLANLGSFIQSDFGISLRLINRFNQVVYSDSITESLGLSDTSTFWFDPISQNTAGAFKLEIETVSQFDKIEGNNELQLEFTVAKETDVAISTVFSPTPTDSFQINMDGFMPSIRVINFGSKKQINIPVTVQLLKNGEVLSSETQFSSLQPNFSEIMVFDSIYPSEPGDLDFIAFTSLAQDSFNLNDTFRVPIFGKVQDDIAVDSTLLPRAGERYLINQNHTPFVTLVNNGEATQINFSTKFRILNKSGKVVFRDSIITSIQALDSRTLSFNHFNISTPGHYVARVIVVNPQDQNKKNDTLDVPFQLVQNNNLEVTRLNFPSSEQIVAKGTVETQPSVILTNPGFVSAGNVPVILFVTDESSNLQYRDTIEVDIEQGSSKTYSFNKLLSFHSVGSFNIEVYHKWQNEALFSSNDSLNSSYLVLNKNDLSVVQNITPIDNDSILLNDLINVKANIKNIGIDTIKDIKLFVDVINPDLDTVLRDTLFFDELAYNEDINLQSSKFYEPLTTGRFTVISSYLGEDDSASNDQVTTYFNVYKDLDLAIGKVVFPLDTHKVYTGFTYKPEVEIVNEGLFSVELATIGCTVWFEDDIIYSSARIVAIDSGERLIVGLDSSLMHDEVGEAVIMFNVIAQGDDYSFNDTLFATFDFSSNARITKEWLRNISVYPNPFKDEVHIESEDRIDEVRVYDMSGKEVYLDTPQGQFFSISLSFLPPGIYYLEMRSGENQVQRKLLKQSN